MALQVTQRLYVDAETGTAYRAFSSLEQSRKPVLYHGDTSVFEVYLMRQSGSVDHPFESVDFPTNSITLAIGTPGSGSVAAATSWTAVASPTATFASDTLTVPTSSIGGSYKLALEYDPGVPTVLGETEPIPFDASTNAISSAVVDVITSNGWSNPQVTVTSVGAGKYTVTARGRSPGLVTYTFVITVTSSLEGPIGYSAELDLTDAAVDTLLGSSTEIDTTLEVQCEDTGKVQTYLQIPCLLRRQVTAP